MATNKEIFFDVYMVELSAAIEKYPNEYAYSKAQVPEVVERMKMAFDKGSYNKDSRAIKRVCKILGIKHTYKAINEFVGVK